MIKVTDEMLFQYYSGIAEKIEGRYYSDSLPEIETSPAFEERMNRLLRTEGISEDTCRLQGNDPTMKTFENNEGLCFPDNDKKHYTGIHHAGKRYTEKHHAGRTGRRRWKIAAAILAIVIGVGGVTVASPTARKKIMNLTQWGQTLHKDAEGSKNDTKSGGRTETQGKTADKSNDRIIYQGKTAAVTESELQRAEGFYRAAGESKPRAQKRAAAYCKEYEALYTEARRQGKTVTEQELNERVKEMRENFHSSDLSAESRKQYREILSQFDSEDEYWEYERTILKKDIPIQKLADDVQEKYYRKHPQADGSDFADYYETYKQRLVKEQGYMKN